MKSEKRWGYCAAIALSVLGAGLLSAVAESKTRTMPRQRPLRQRPPKEAQEKARDSGHGIRIVGGQPAAPGAWPWMAGLLDANDPNAFMAQFCGGSLVHPYWVLTAAHCVIDTFPEELDVLIGTENLNQTAGALRIPVAEIILHPQYNPVTDDADLALLRLSVPVLDRATLPPIDDAALDAEGIWSTVIGWGATNGAGTAFTAELMEVEIPIANFDVANAPASFDGSLTPNMLAAGLASGGIDSCSGDSGGPLMVPSPFPPGWMLAGIVSFGLGGLDCAAPGNYGIYTRVLNYRRFIKNHIAPFYSDFEVETGVAGPWRDPDLDGIPNLLEFAFRSNPLQPSAEDLPGIALRAAPGGWEPFVHFRKPVLAEDIAYRIEYVPTLTDIWQPYDLAAARFASNAVPGDSEAEEWRIAPPASFDPRQGAFRVLAGFSDNLVNAPRELFFPGALQGSLTPQDELHPTRAGRFMKAYRLLDLPVGLPVTVTLRSIEMDAWLELLDEATGAVLATSSSNAGGGLDEQIEFTPAAGVSYLLRASSEAAGETGLFEVAVFRIPPSTPLLGVPETLFGALTVADEFDPLYLPGSQFYKRDYLLDAPAGVDISIRMDSAEVDAYLSVVNAENGRVVAEDDDSGGGLNARLVFTPQAGVHYLVRATTAVPLETGSFTLSTEFFTASDTLTLGTVEDGALTSGDPIDPRFTGTYYINDFDLVGLTGGQRVILDQTSPVIDSFLQLINKSTGAVLDENDDYGDSPSSRIIFTVQPGITYVARASSFFEMETGPYSVSLQPLRTIGRPATVSGQLTTNDAIDHRFSVTYRIVDYELTGVSAGQTVTVTMTSANVDAWLTILNRDTGEEIAEDGYGGGGTNAQLSFTVQPGVVYLIRATTASPDETGAFTLQTQ